MAMNVQEAIRDSIKTEKNIMDFYRLGADRMENCDARKVFELLAREEREHAGQFYKYYKGTDIPSLEEFLGLPPEESMLISSLHRLIDSDFSEKKALELAMKTEKDLHIALLEMAVRISDFEVKAVFELNARETQNHYLMIEAEYARMMGMVAESDMNTFVRE